MDPILAVLNEITPTTAQEEKQDAACYGPVLLRLRQEVAELGRSIVRSLSTENEPGTPRARIPATVLSLSLSTTPSNVIRPAFTMM